MGTSLYFRDGFSDKKPAVYSRTKRLLDDGYADRTKASKKKSDNRKRSRKARIEQDTKAKILNLRGSLLTRIRFHLGRGRDAGDIAIRENLRTSVVRSAIDQIQKEAHV